MHRLVMIVIGCLLSMGVNIGYAQIMIVKSMAAMAQTDIVFNVTKGNPQFVSLKGLSVKNKYTLRCSPNLPTRLSSNVRVQLWTGSPVRTAIFGGQHGDSIEFTNLVPYKQESNEYAIEYQLETDSIFMQSGSCSFQ